MYRLYKTLRLLQKMCHIIWGLWVLSWICKGNKSFFIFQYLEGVKKQAISSEKIILVFHVSFDKCEKDLKNILLKLRKSVMCYEYFNSWEKINKKIITSKRNILQRAKKNLIYQIKTANMHKKYGIVYLT